MKIIVEAVLPPIPVRWWDYRAYIEGHEDNSELYGWGQTEEEALINFVQNLLADCGADLYEVWPGAASERKNCNVRLANPFRLKEEPC